MIAGFEGKLNEAKKVQTGLEIRIKELENELGLSKKTVSDLTT